MPEGAKTDEGNRELGGHDLPQGAVGDTPVIAKPHVAPTWVNSPVLMEALQRYEQGRLPQHLRGCRGVLELSDNEGCTVRLLPSLTQGGHTSAGLQGPCTSILNFIPSCCCSLGWEPAHPLAAAHGPDSPAAQKTNQQFKLRHHIERLNHRGRMAVLKDAETCLGGASNVAVCSAASSANARPGGLSAANYEPAPLVHQRYSQQDFSGRTATAAAPTRRVITHHGNLPRPRRDVPEDRRQGAGPRLLRSRSRS